MGNSRKSAACFATLLQNELKGNVVHFTTHTSNLSCNKSGFYRLRKVVAKSELSFLLFFELETKCPQLIPLRIKVGLSKLKLNLLLKGGCFALSFRSC